MPKLVHIAFIMDGNGRWAKKRLLNRFAGHKEGIKVIERLINHAFNQDIKCLSFFAFSTENWQRPKKEVDSLMGLLKEYLPSISRLCLEKNARLIFTGELSVFNHELQDVILKAQHDTAHKNGGIINIALNYGGRGDIINAVNSAIASGQRVTEQSFSKMLYTAELSDPDLLIRTGGEQRLSNFMLYQTAYTELYFSPKLWPEFDETDLQLAIDDYHSRNRTFGKV